MVKIQMFYVVNCVCDILIFLSITDGNIDDVKIFKEGSKAVYSVQFSDVNHKSEFVFERRSSFFSKKSFKASDRISVIVGSGGVVTIEINNVSKSDKGMYFVHNKYDDNLKYRVKTLLLLTIGKDHTEYNTTMLLEASSTFDVSLTEMKICAQNIRHENEHMSIMKLNTTGWTRMANDERFDLLLSINSHLLSIISNNMTKDDEGIYWFVLYRNYYYLYGNDCLTDKSVRLLIKDLTFANKKSITIATEGKFLSLVCEINSGYHVEKLYIEAKEMVLISGDPPIINYTFVPTREDNLVLYTCKAKILDYTTTFDSTTRLLINHLTFANKKSITIATEGKFLSLVCEIHSGYQVEKLYIEANGIVLISGDSPIINYTFVPTREDNLVLYTCKAKILDYTTTIDSTTQLVVNLNHVCTKEIYLILSCVAAFIFFVYSMVLQTVCWLQNRKLKVQSHDTTPNVEYDEIGTINYHSISIQPLSIREPLSNQSADADLSTIGEAVVDVSNTSHISSESTTPSETSDEEGANLVNQQTREDSAHAYTQALNVTEDEHKYSDCIVRYCNSETPQRDNVNRNEHYINLRI